MQKLRQAFLFIDERDFIDGTDIRTGNDGTGSDIAIGSDLDGIFGTEQSPWDMNSIADLQKYQDILSKRGYKQQDIENIFSKNWLRFLRKAWS